MTHRFNWDDRILVLQSGSHTAPQLREWAQAVPQGILVGLGDPGTIGTARRELADCENVLFSHGSREEIPWRDGFFTVIIDTEVRVETPETRRVLHPSGRIYSIQP